eukprot:4936098-Pleurochrysis_carterae.AAC.1
MSLAASFVVFPHVQSQLVLDRFSFFDAKLGGDLYIPSNAIPQKGTFPGNAILSFFMENGAFLPTTDTFIMNCPSLHSIDFGNRVRKIQAWCAANLKAMRSLTIRQNFTVHNGESLHSTPAYSTYFSKFGSHQYGAGTYRKTGNAIRYHEFAGYFKSAPINPDVGIRTYTLDFLRTDT